MERKSFYRKRMSMMLHCVRGIAVLVGAVLSALALSCCFSAIPAVAQGHDPAPVNIIVDGRVLDLDPPAVRG